MTETASKELCAELYELTGWDDSTLSHDSERNEYGVTVKSWPLYSCGYLLRKLPKDILPDTLSSYHADFYLSPGVVGTWNAGYRTGAAEPSVRCRANTPEDALTSLAIELFKQGILQRGTQE